MGGNLPAQMNWPGTTANTRGTAPSSARSATGHFPGRTTSPYTWRGTFKSQNGGCGPHCQKRIQYFLPFTPSSRWGEEPSWKALQSRSSSQQVSLCTDNQEMWGNWKTNQRADGVLWLDLLIIPILNPTWIFLDLQECQGSDWKLWISGYKLDPWVGGRKDQNSLELCFNAM